MYSEHECVHMVVHSAHSYAHTPTQQDTLWVLITYLHMYMCVWQDTSVRHLSQRLLCAWTCMECVYCLDTCHLLWVFCVHSWGGSHVGSVWHRPSVWWMQNFLMMISLYWSIRNIFIILWDWELYPYLTHVWGLQNGRRERHSTWCVCVHIHTITYSISIMCKYTCWGTQLVVNDCRLSLPLLFCAVAVWSMHTSDNST